MEGKRETVRYETLAGPCGEVGMVWHAEPGKPRLLRILLPRVGQAMTDRIRSLCPAAMPMGGVAGGGEPPFVRAIRLLLRGEETTFDLSCLDRTRCGSFQWRVLLQAAAIPRGFVCSYGDLGCLCGVEKGARAVGQAMARNPFPLVLPCHRVVRADGSLGGFGGGLALKEALLRGEGVRFAGPGRVAPECRWRPTG